MNNEATNKEQAQDAQRPSEAGTTPCYALTAKENEQACICIYMNLHVSQLSAVSEAIRKAWTKGQKLYAQKVNGA